jgi:hypothetical protein
MLVVTGGCELGNLAATPVGSREHVEARAANMSECPLLKALAACGHHAWRV